MTPCLDAPCSVPGCGRPNVGLLLAGKGQALAYCAEHEVSFHAGIQSHYLLCRLEGTSHRLAEMLAFRQPPMSNTDREFLEGRGGCYDQFGQGAHAEVGTFYEQVAQEAGVDTTGKVYLSGLAAYPGDPQAWVSGRSDVQRVCEQRGWSCQGAVNVDGSKFRDTAPPEEVDVAPDLVVEHTERALEADPGLRERPLEEVREQVRERITPHWSK